MTSVDGGILLLLGPDDDNRDLGWSIAMWKVEEEEAGGGGPLSTVTPDSMPPQLMASWVHWIQKISKYSSGTTKRLA
ncbi:hypothetical protein HFO06_33945 [Rhizobium leguminosarum]|uniref:hypothetical protein n=1 Tax=Rhizobium leguminosarum TaxID=384 RepID=UPI001C949FF5|nr:hypothetical protein [Rhizobium leguminosarum]MBY5768025.1 hypothetical protein [Rhizobium leguminosarum]